MPYVVRPMSLEDIDEVCQVEKQCFSSPWPASAYRREVKDNRLGRYIVLSWVNGDPPPVAGGPTGDHLSGDHRAADAHIAPLEGVRRAVANLPRLFGLGAIDAEPEPKREIIAGFAGMWLMIDEAHITTIGVGEHFRGLGLGELLLSSIMIEAAEIGAHRVTLEVRVSNNVAQSLYRKYGFVGEGIRKRYYSDNNEDALIMWSDSLSSPEYSARLAELRAAVLRRTAALLAPPFAVLTRETQTHHG